MFNTKRIKQLEQENLELRSNSEAIKRHQEIINEIEQNEKILNDLKEKIIDYSAQIEYQDLNIYMPHFEYFDSESYKVALRQNINNQKFMISKKVAINCPMSGTVGFNGNKQKGNNIVTLITKLLLSTFNSFCNEAIDNSNCFCYDKYENAINKKFNELNNLTKILGISISDEYLKLKIEQLQLEIDKKFKIEQEKEEERHQQEIIKEQEKIDKEILAQKEKLQNERKKYENELLKCAENEKEQIESKINEIDEQIKNDDYRLINNKAGYCYFIKNCDMKDNMIKIGVTRRLNPQDRIDELSNAGHAFKFDICGMVFSDDVFNLETKLHQYFAPKRVNSQNYHKEFFYVTTDEIENALENFGYNVKLDPNPINEQYILSQKERNF